VGDINIYIDTFDGTWGDNRQWEGSTIVKAAQATVVPPGLGSALKITLQTVSSGAITNSYYPSLTPVGGIAYKGGSDVSISLQARRDSTTLYGDLFIEGHQIPGVQQDLVSSMNASANSWESLNLSFTPTSDGVASILFRSRQTENVAGSLYISDLKVG
jgi:hypothetical protein